MGLYKNTALLPLGINENAEYAVTINQANITLNISTNYVLQPAIEANYKRPTVFSDFVIYSIA
jgi:hypothetical protein